MPEKNDRAEALRQLGPYLNLGSMFAVSLLLGTGAGYWLDGKLGTRPWLTLVGSLLGVALGFYYFFDTVRKRPSQ